MTAVGGAGLILIVTIIGFCQINILWELREINRKLNPSKGITK